MTSRHRGARPKAQAAVARHQHRHQAAPPQRHCTSQRGAAAVWRITRALPAAVAVCESRRPPRPPARPPRPERRGAVRAPTVAATSPRLRRTPVAVRQPTRDHQRLAGEAFQLHPACLLEPGQPPGALQAQVSAPPSRWRPQQQHGREQQDAWLRASTVRPPWSGRIVPGRCPVRGSRRVAGPRPSGRTRILPAEFGRRRSASCPAGTGTGGRASEDSEGLGRGPSPQGRAAADPFTRQLHWLDTPAAYRRARRDQPWYFGFSPCWAR